VWVSGPFWTDTENLASSRGGGFGPGTVWFVASIILMSPVKFLMRIETDFLKTGAVLGDVSWRWYAVQEIMYLRQVRRTEILQSQSEANIDACLKPKH
jgi:hypothetical protein